jgi:hypothetical protein
MRVLRASERFRTEQPGIVSLHCFSAGPHYDPDNLSFGPLIGCDEHQMAPAAGFAEHAHRGVEILSWVLDGVLHHSDHRGSDRLLPPGERMVQSVASDGDRGGGIRHTEANASADHALRLLQITLIDQTRYGFDCISEDRMVDADWIHAFVAAGEWSVGGVRLEPGDSVRATGSIAASGWGELLVLTAFT